MKKEEYEGLKTKFLKAIARVPEEIRNNDTIAIINDNPYTWNTAAIAIKNNTQEGEKILKSLKDLEII
jgi:hypothetical protein